MPLLFYRRIQGEPRKCRVYLEHYQPEILPPEVRARGIWVDELPAPPLRTDPDKVPVLLVDPETKEVWYEFETVPLRRRS